MEAVKSIYLCVILLLAQGNTNLIILSLDVTKHIINHEGGEAIGLYLRASGRYGSEGKLEVLLLILRL